MNRRKLGILTAAIVATMTILPMSGAAATEPLAVGAYDLVLDGKALTIAIGEDGTASVSADDGLIVLLNYDELGRVLNIVRIETPQGAYELDVDVADDGSYTQTVSSVEVDESSDDDVVAGDEGGAVEDDLADDDESADEDDGDDGDDDSDEDETDDGQLGERHGAIVSTVARCAPRGRTAKDGGWPNHGTIVSSAANGLPLELTLADPSTGEPMDLTADLTTLAGAEAFCAFVSEHEAAVAASDLDDDQTSGKDDETDEDDEKADKKADKAAQKAEKKDAKSSTKKAEKAEKAERKSDKKDKKDKGGSEDA